MDKRRINISITESRYKQLNEYINSNNILTTKLNYGTIIEMGLNLFFKETEKKTLEHILIENINKY